MHNLRLISLMIMTVAWVLMSLVAASNHIKYRNLQKQAVEYNFAEYDETGEWRWKLEN